MNTWNVQGYSSSSAKKDVKVLLDRTWKNNFDVIITTDDIDKGKPDHTTFITALNRMKTDTSEAIVVENARYEWKLQTMLEYNI